MLYKRALISTLAVSWKPCRSGIELSIEGGGALCGHGSGATMAAAALRAFAPFVAAGGTVSHWLLESVYSRTSAGCRSQPQATTTAELADYAAAIQAGGLGHPAFFLYDALPHYKVSAMQRVSK